MQQTKAAQDKVATSYEGRQAEMKITSGVLALAAMLTKSPTLMKASIVVGAAALTDQKVTTGNVDAREVAVTAIGAAPGVGSVAKAASGMAKIGEAAQTGQEFVHAGAAAAGAGLAVGEAMPEHGSNSVTRQPPPIQKQDNPSASKFSCTEKHC